MKTKELLVLHSNWNEKHGFCTVDRGAIDLMSSSYNVDAQHLRGIELSPNFLFGLNLPKLWVEVVFFGVCNTLTACRNVHLSTVCTEIYATETSAFAMVKGALLQTHVFPVEKRKLCCAVVFQEK